MSIHLCWKHASCDAPKYGAPARLYVNFKSHHFVIGRGEFYHWRSPR